MSEALAEPAPALSRRARLALLGAAWLAIYAAGPGIAARDGLPALAALGLGAWAWGASRPGRTKFWIEALCAGVAWCGICSWAAKVHPSALLVLGPGFGIYFASTGALLRRLAARWPLALAAPAAWVGVESVRAVLDPPFGMKWMRLGTHLHDIGWLSGSARVWGVLGLSWVLAALGGGIADLWIARRAEPAEFRRRLRWALAAGVGPLVAAAALAAATHPPETEVGPRVLLVQPAIPQARKMRGLTAQELLDEGVQLTRRGLLEAERAGERPVDLVAWGESMLPLELVDPGLREAVRRGAQAAEWTNESWTEREVDECELVEQRIVREALLSRAQGRRGALPPGAAFASGAIVRVARGDLIGRLGAVVLWRADGARAGAVGKVHRVPGAETMLGLERFEWVRRTIHSLAGYVPDLVAHQGSRRLAFTDRGGREWVFGASVCFDNAFDRPFVDPVREGRVDFHLVTSNEAWFLGDQEPDQMLAFTHLAAIETGRSVVRATNSGISAVVDPSGRDVARLTVAGRDKEVPGTLRADVPVPLASQREQRTLYVRTWRLWPALGLLVPAALLFAGLRGRRGYKARAEG